MNEVTIWDDGLSIDRGPIDLQHKQLLALTTTISAAAKAGNLEETHALFLQLGRECRTHFSTEETYMEQLQYPHREEHRQEHHRLLRHVEGLLEPRVADSPGDTAAVMDCIRSLVIMHILNDDLEIRHFIQEQASA